MPSLCNASRVLLVWLFRAWASRRSAQVIFLAAFASSLSSDCRDDNPQHRTKAADAVCSWQTVNSGFFPPEFLPRSRQEQVGHRREDQMAFQPQVAAALVLVQPDLALLVLKAALHPPTRERDQEQGPDAHPRGRVADEELHLVRIQHVAGHHQVERLTRQAVGPLDRQHHVLALPDHRSLLAVLDSEPSPRPVTEPRVIEQLVEPPGRPATAGQTRDLAGPAAAVLVARPDGDPRRLEPADKA